MINLLLQDTDSIPFMLRENVVASIDTIPANDFMSYQYLPLDSSKMFYNIDAMGHEAVLSGLEGVARPFMQQVGGVLFLVFAVLFVLSAFVFSNSGLSHFSGIRSMFTVNSRGKKPDKEPITSIDAWSKLFYAFQTFVLYSILFLDFAVQGVSKFYSSYDNLILFSQIFIGIMLFVLTKYLFYSLMGGVFSKSKISVLIKTYLSVVYFTGVLSFLPILAYIYIPEVRMYVLLFLIAVFIVGRVAVIIQTFVFFAKAHIGSFYFFVYLCGIEILPYFLLYKAVVSIN